MFQWLSSNLPTILVALVILTVCALIVFKMIRDKKQGKSSCSCGCSGCAMSNMCHAQNAPRPKQADEAQKEIYLVVPINNASNIEYTLRE